MNTIIELEDVINKQILELEDYVDGGVTLRIEEEGHVYSRTVSIEELKLSLRKLTTK